MDCSDKEEIIWATEIITTWEWRFGDSELLAVFSVLDELPKDKHPEEWSELREAFRNNKELNHPRVREQIRIPSNVEDNNWWWDHIFW